MNSPQANVQNDTETVIVIVDPSHDHHPALDNFIHMAYSATDDSSIELVIAVAPTSKESEDKNLITCSNTWVEDNIDEALRPLGMPYTVQYLWTYYWDNAILELNKHYSADLTIVPYYSDLPGNFYNDDKWKLLRNATNPILISSDQDYAKANTILCALKIQDEDYADRNQRVVEAAGSLSSFFNLEIHAVNAYSDSMEFPDRAKISQQTGIANERVHVKVGDPQEVICEVADSIDANLVLIASQQRSGLHGALHGNMIEKIIEKMDRSILMV